MQCLRGGGFFISTTAAFECSIAERGEFGKGFAGRFRAVSRNLFKVIPCIRLDNPSNDMLFT